MRKYVPVPTAAISDQRLSDAELRLLINLIANYGTGSAKNGTVDLHFSDADIGRLGMHKSTFYRLLSGLLKCEYLQRKRDTGGYTMQVPIVRLTGLNNEIEQSQIRDCETPLKETEEERSKEEDKEYIYNNTLSDSNSSKVPENEKEKEIQKKEKDESEEVPERFSAEYREIIDYLNEKTGKKFSARSRVNQGHMSARLKEGFTVDDFKKVIDIKWFQWHDDPKMAKFLRPETLFGTKFDRYLNEDKAVMKVSANGWEYLQTEEPNFMDELLGASNG